MARAGHLAKNCCRKAFPQLWDRVHGCALLFGVVLSFCRVSGGAFYADYVQAADNKLLRRKQESP